MPNILVIGSLNVDLVVRAPRFPTAGETIQGEDLATIPGGKGANQAVASARQGANVSMLGRVGKDNFGDFLLVNLKENKVNTNLVQRDDASTGSAIIIVNSNGQNNIVLSPGANGKVTPLDVNSASFLGFNLLLLQLEIPLETVLSAAKRARRHGLNIILNPAPAQTLTNELIALTDFIIPNENELSLLTNSPVNDINSAESAARILLARGAKNVIVTLGEKGALIVNKDVVKHIAPFKVKVVDTTAAGDAFIGGFANAIIENQALEEAVRHGCACGALATTKFGAQPSLPTKDEVNNLL